MLKLSELEKEGFQGTDASLEISLFEYGLIWQKIEKDSYSFIYGITIDDEGKYNKFDYALIDKNEFMELIKNEWFDLKGMEEFSGMNKNNLIANFPSSVFDCKNYHNIADIFGASYTEGEEVENDNN